MTCEALHSPRHQIYVWGHFSIYFFLNLASLEQDEREDLTIIKRGPTKRHIREADVFSISTCDTIHQIDLRAWSTSFAAFSRRYAFITALSGLPAGRHGSVLGHVHHRPLHEEDKQVWCSVQMA